MRQLETLLLWASALGAVVLAADPPRPRGVGPEFSKFYKSSESFACISDPGAKLDAARVNDDYCDCADGSDEPGTAACAHLSPRSPASPYGARGNLTVALPGFYCKNKGHRPAYVPFTHVNDGVCDHELCCDGSDEWAGVGGISCPDRCKEIGKEWRRQDEQRKKALGAAAKERRGLVEQAAVLKKEVADRVGTLGAEIQAAEKKAADLERELAEVERRERGRVVRDPGKGKKVNVLVRLAKDRVDELREALSYVIQQRDLARTEAVEMEGILAAFKEEYNPNFNDEGVKRAVRRWEEFAETRVPQGVETWGSHDLAGVLQEDGADSGIDWAEWQGAGESDVDVLYDFEAYLPGPVRDWLDGKLRELRLLLIANGILAEASGVSESAAVTSARTALNTARDAERDLRSSLDSLSVDLGQDYGADDVFRALKGKCVEADSGEYTYEHCYLGSTTQKPKKGGSNTSLGTFGRIEAVEVDDGALPADGRGLGSGRRVALRYENGQACWNGPARSVLVVLGCGERDEIWRVREEEKCVYRFEGASPAVCEGEVEGGKEGKDEL
ncbi:MAG: hypothetical protein M1832_002715 [Thelocarpon impressellum]|nr:MAG: hypothetical protein M1832_002715 [Thelocarpon impressellum]